MRYIIRNTSVDQVRQIGGKDIKETRVAIFATLTPEQREKLKQLGAVIEESKNVQSMVLPPVPVAGVPTWSPASLIYATGINQIREMTTPRLYGQGFDVAVVGTGIRETHEQIGGRVVYRKNYTSDPHTDAFDHETGVAAIIVTIVPLCNILDIKVMDSKGQGTDEQVVLAIDDLISMKEAESEYSPHVINLSLGTVDTGNPNDPLRAICREAISRGIFVFASAGNGGADISIMSPACEKYVFAVGSIDPIARDSRIVDFTISDFSSRGPTKEGLVKPDGVFFGRDIELASSASDTAVVAKSGTSFSAPFASGACVLFLEGEKYWGGMQPPSWWFMVSPTAVPYPMTPEGLIDVFMPLTSVKPAGAPRDKDNEYGWGLPYGPLILERLGLRPAAAVASITEVVVPVMGIGIVGMMMASMAKALK
jgi:serine protease AprX